MNLTNQSLFVIFCSLKFSVHISHVKNIGNVKFK